MDEMLIVIAIVAGFACVLLLRFVIPPWLDKRQVVRMIEKQGGTIIRIDPDVPPAGPILFGSPATAWRVRYRTADDDLRVAECSATFLRCKITKDEKIDES